jgi:putative ABC transport system permease protein
MYIASYKAFLSLEDSYDFTYEKLEFADAQFLTRDNPLDSLEEIRSLPGVKNAEARVIASASLSSGQKEEMAAIEARMIGLTTEEQKVNKVHILKGQSLEDGSVWVERHFAEEHSLKPGDTLTFEGLDSQQKLKVAGIVSSPEYLWVAKNRSDVMPSPKEFGVFFTSQESLASLGSLNSYYDVVITSGDSNRNINALEELLAPYQLIDVIEKEKQISYELLKLDLKGFQELAYIFPVLFLSVSGFIIFILLSRLVDQQRPIIGTLRSLGYSQKAIRWHYLKFSVILSVIGGILGTIVGYFFGDAVFEMYRERVGLPFGENHLYMSLWVTGILFSVLIGALAGYFPARKAAKLRPVEAMRASSPKIESKVYKWLIKRLDPMIRRLPLTFRTVIRNMFRSIGRYALTIFGIAVAISLVFTTSGMLDSVKYIINQQFDEVENYDLSVIFHEPLDEEAMEQILATEGISKQEGVLDIPVNATVNGQSMQTMLRGIDDSQELYRVYENIPWLNLSSGKVEIPEDGVLISKSVQSQLKIGVGDEIKVESPLYQESATYIVGGIVNLPVGSIMIQDLSQVHETFVGSPSVGFNKAFLDVSGDKQAIMSELAENPSVVSVQDHANMTVQLNNFMGLFNLFILIMFIFSIVLAAAILFSVIFINVMERKNEITTLRAFGYSKRRILNLFAVEHVFISIIALTLGVVFGLEGMLSVSLLYNSDVLTFPIFIQPVSIVWTLILLIFVVLIAQLVSQRVVNQFKLADVIKEMAR